MRRLALSAVLLSTCTISHANDELYTTRYSSCMDQAGGVTVEMLDCIGEELNTQDARLNGAYQKLRAQLSAERRKALQSAQRLWIQYRDANCDF
ncbi:lysozyme inhibitor LprI family protein [Allochromatium vinosum]|uniref:lysozyme inhibitor LprI family protein n=1 Tax=Allochromatium vinosum TaxID=1049 RepID=UPI0001A77368|nr:lysozyme inhibitor LprI family protein [Allochromatium vinosum]